MSSKFGTVLQIYILASPTGRTQRYAYQKLENQKHSLLKHCTQKVNFRAKSCPLIENLRCVSFIIILVY